MNNPKEKRKPIIYTNPFPNPVAAETPKFTIKSKNLAEVKHNMSKWKLLKDCISNEEETDVILKKLKISDFKISIYNSVRFSINIFDSLLPILKLWKKYEEY